MAIKFEKVGYTYGRETAFSSMGLNDINTVIEKNTFNSVIGHTGSGKTTLLQALDGLIKISTGTISLKNMVINVNSDEKSYLFLESI
ncbi:cobalt import ATP-binding protein CbiO 2 family protein [Lactobacillus iners LactinV 09V1-c]|nr:cobalt import ATP-binding protein CbiO 2 family protein [Lactobacillus iners LactinV 09V1-c]